jgi:hypothetical protein
MEKDEVSLQAIAIALNVCRCVGCGRGMNAWNAGDSRAMS